MASGGHTHLFEVREGGVYRLLGKTRDDAAGEAFDKVAKLLGFGYPGGPVIDRLAPHGNPLAVHFTFAKMKGNALDFSFSGLKTAVLRWVEAHRYRGGNRRPQGHAARSSRTRRWSSGSQSPRKQTFDLLASFQHAVIHELLTRAAAAAEDIGARGLIVSGGVACNSGTARRRPRRQPALSGSLPHPPDSPPITPP